MRKNISGQNECKQKIQLAEVSIEIVQKYKSTKKYAQCYLINKSFLPDF